MQEAAFRTEQKLKRIAWLHEKEKDAYTDRRNKTRENDSERAADVRGSELFRRETFLSQTRYDRDTHSSARSSIITHQYRGKRKRDIDEDRLYNDDAGRKSGGEEEGDGRGDDDYGSDYDNEEEGQAKAGEDMVFNPYDDSK